jgi:hypothetical protein
MLMARSEAEQEVLERRLLADQPASASQRAEQVERQREDLQRHEQGEQVVRGDEEHHAAQREQRQREHLGATGLADLPPVRLTTDGDGRLGHERPTALQPALADEQQRHHAQHHERALQEERRPVDGQGRTGGEALGHVVRGSHHHHQRRGQGDEGEPELQQWSAAPGGERLDEHADTRGAEQDEQRRHRQVVQRRELDVDGQHLAGSRQSHLPASCTEGAGSDLPTSCIVAATAGLMTSSSGLG